MAIDAEQRTALLGAKARALVSGHGVDVGEAAAVGLPGAAALVVDGTGWFVLGDGPETALGGIVAWSDRAGLGAIRLLVDDPTAASVLARRAQPFALDIDVLRVDGHTLVPTQPAAHAAPLTPSAAALDLAALLADAGAEVVIEAGIVRGEVAGLEIARVVQGADGPTLEVGVGRNDREAFAMVHGDVPTGAALAGVVQTVQSHRHVGEPAHPLNRLAGERWLRHRLVRDPTLVGAARLEPVEPTVPRGSLHDVAAAIAVGERADGQAVVVAASVGIDLDVVPAGADARAALGRDAQLVIAVPERDAHPVTRRLADLLEQPAELIAVPPASA